MCNNVKRFFDKLMAPPYSYSTSFSHSVLAASALWAMVQYYGGGEEFKFGYAGLGLILIQGCAGMWRYARTSNSTSWCKFFDMSAFIATVFSLPFILVDLYMDYGFCYEICYVHLVYPLIVFIPMISSRDKRERLNKEVTDMIVFISEISLCLISVLQETKYCGLAAALTHMFTHFVVTQKGRTMGIPSIDFYNYGLCAFLFFILHSLLCGGIYWTLNNCPGSGILGLRIPQFNRGTKACMPCTMEGY